MCLLISEYEKKHYSIEAPVSVEAIKFRMESQGLTVKDLEPAIGKPNRVYGVLNLDNLPAIKDGEVVKLQNWGYYPSPI